VDLGAADPTYILPAVVTLGFLAVTEIGMDGIQMQVRCGCTRAYMHAWVLEQSSVQVGGLGDGP
jgi:hypothetical protein